MQRTPPAPVPASGPGILALFGVLIGAGCLLVGAISVPNTLFDLDLALRVGGSRTALPDSWDAVAGLVAVGVALIVLSLFGSWVIGRFQAAAGRPLLRVGIVVSAVTLLLVVGRGVQVLALTQTYGSMLAYYATYEDVSALQAELVDAPDRDDLDQAVDRAAQYDNEAALALLLDAGADLRAESMPPEHRRCAIVGRSLAFVRVAFAHGVTPATCPNGETAIWEAVKWGTEEDAATAELVVLLRAAGWSPTATGDEQTPAQIAAAKGWTATVRALSAP